MKPTPTCADVGAVLKPLVAAWQEECIRSGDRNLASMPDVEFKALVERVRTLNALIDAARLILTELRNK